MDSSANVKTNDLIRKISVPFIKVKKKKGKSERQVEQSQRKGQKNKTLLPFPPPRFLPYYISLLSPLFATFLMIFFGPLWLPFGYPLYLPPLATPLATPFGYT